MVLHKRYVAIDLKSFYASVECVERGLDPLTTNLVVADISRTEKTICLAVSPALKEYGISGRARLFEVVQKVKEINARRKSKAPGYAFTGSSSDANELKANSFLALDYIIAMPRMALYMDYSTRVYKTYLNYVAPEDIHVYSIDEVFMDITGYLSTYNLTAHELAEQMIQNVFQTTGITATAGIGTNLYLCKVAMDIVAKHLPADEHGVRIAELNESSYRKQLWDHRPITDFWRVGKGYARRLETNGLFTMGDIARCSLGSDDDYFNQKLLYTLFGVNAELLIDHAWGWEPCTMADIKAYKPESSSLSSGQVLQRPYDFEGGKLIAREMVDLLVLDLVAQELVTDQIVLTVGYDIENLTDTKRQIAYRGPITIDHYGRRLPKHAHGTANLEQYTSSTKQIMNAAIELYDRIVDRNLLVRRINVVVNHTIPESQIVERDTFEQLNLFLDDAALQIERAEEREKRERERKIQQAMLNIKQRFGKNAILKGMNLQKGAMTMERNRQVGGHRA